MSYKVEIIDKKDPGVQLEASKLSIKNLFSDLLNETKVSDYCKNFVKKIQAQWGNRTCSSFISIQ